MPESDSLLDDNRIDIVYAGVHELSISSYDWDEMVGIRCPEKTRNIWEKPERLLAMLEEVHRCPTWLSLDDYLVLDGCSLELHGERSVCHPGDRAG